jgi:hypothetical protein
MKLTLLLPALVLGLIISTSSETLAFGGAPGGPFSSGSYFPNDGTFSAVVRGENLTGTLQFSTTEGSGPTGGAVSTTDKYDWGFGFGEASTTTRQEASGGIGSTGVATIYYDGDSFTGNSQGAPNGVESTLTVNFQAAIVGQGEKKIEVKTPVTTSETTNVINPLTGQVTPVQTTQTEFVPTREIHYYDSLYLNGFAECKTSNKFPNQKFEGSGEAELQFLVFTGNTPFPEAVNVPISITGVRLSNASQAFNTQNIRTPSVNEFSVLVE